MIDDQDKRRLAVQKGVASSFNDAFNEFITWDGLKRRIVVTLPDHSKTREWLKKFTKFRKLNPNSTPKEFDEYNILIDEILVGINERVNRSDDLTRIAAMNFDENLYEHYEDVNPRIFLKPLLLHNGRLVHIWGNPGSGKTDYCLKLIENAIKEDFTILTNILIKRARIIKYGEIIEVENPIDNLYRSIRLSDLLYQMIIFREQRKNLIVAWDEVSLFYHKQEAPTKKNIDLGKLLRLIRKFNANVFFLEQIDEGLTSVVNEMMCAKFEKEGRKRLHYTTRVLDRNYNLFLESIPPTTIKFDTYDFAGFDMDVNLSEMFSKINIEGENKTEEIKKYLWNIIKKNKGKEKQIEAGRKALAEVHKNIDERKRGKKGEFVAQ